MYDFGDTTMMEALRPSIEEAFPIQSQVWGVRRPHSACLPALLSTRMPARLVA